MASLNTLAPVLLSTTTGINMKAVASTAIYVVPAGRTLRITGIIIRDSATASLAGGVASVTGWRQTFSFGALVTTGTGYIHVYGADLAQYTEQAAATTINFSVTTGITAAAATATVDLFGILT